MIRGQRQEFCIKSVPIEELQALENILNSMSKEGWDLYSIYEGEINNKVVYNVIFAREIEIEEGEDYEDIQGYKTKMEKMFSSKEEPYELCLNFQRKIKEKREKIEEIKNFLDGAKDNERDVLNEEIAKEVDRLNNLKKQLKNLLSPSKMAEIFVYVMRFLEQMMPCVSSLSFTFPFPSTRMMQERVYLSSPSLRVFRDWMSRSLSASVMSVLALSKMLE